VQDDVVIFAPPCCASVDAVTVAMFAAVTVIVTDAAESEAEALDKPFVASMGMYVFRRQVLQELLATRFPKVTLLPAQHVTNNI
jgi:ADP-glucose pyrophosphorylase